MKPKWPPPVSPPFWNQHPGNLLPPRGKAWSIHQRDSWEDTIEVLRKYLKPRVRAVMHCFDAGSGGHKAPGSSSGSLAISFRSPASWTVWKMHPSEGLREAAKIQSPDRNELMVENRCPLFSRRHQNRTKKTLPSPAFIIPRNCPHSSRNLRGMSLAAIRWAQKLPKTPQRILRIQTRRIGLLWIHREAIALFIFVPAFNSFSPLFFASCYVREVPVTCVGK